MAVVLRLDPHALHQCDPQTKRILASYYYKDVASVFEVSDYPGGFIVKDSLYGRLHLFASEGKAEVLQRMAEFAQSHLGIQMDKPRQATFANFAEAKFGQFSADLHITSLSEFTVYKQSARHADPVRRLLCLTETCLLERDPATYSIVSLRPLTSVSALIRSLENTQLFSLQYSSGDVR